MSDEILQKKAHYHLPGLFEFYEFYRVFLPLYREYREYFYDWCDISSIYGSPQGCQWGGGRIGFANNDFSPDEVREVFDLMQEYQISARLTFSNSLLTREHLGDKKCNLLCKLLESAKIPGGVIVHSDLLASYLKKIFPRLYLVSSTTKVLTDFEDFRSELDRAEFCSADETCGSDDFAGDFASDFSGALGGDFAYVVPDFRLNKSFDKLALLNQKQKNKVEFLCNECCDINCTARKKCYENVSLKNLDENENKNKNVVDFKCSSPDASNGYKFSKAMKNPSFISIDDIQSIYLPMGFSNFKIEGRNLGSAILLEFLLYYMTKPEHQLEVREAIYLDSMLDLF